MRFFDWFESKPKIVNLANTAEESIRRDFRQFWNLFFERNTSIQKFKLQNYKEIIIDELTKAIEVSPKEKDEIKWAKNILEKHGYEVVDL